MDREIKGREKSKPDRRLGESIVDRGKKRR